MSHNLHVFNFSPNYDTSPHYYASDKDLALNPLESTPPSMQVVWPSTFNVLTVIILLLTLVVVKNVNDVFLGAFARATVSEF